MLFYFLHGFAKDHIDMTYIDSLSYEQYMRGQWDDLLQTGRIAKQHQIDFMYLQQRLGYAHFVKKQYYQSMMHYDKAAKFGKDEITQLYQYYNALYTNNTAFARYHASHLSVESKEYLKIPKFKIIDAIDIEYSHKIPATTSIHNASYKRIGLNSLLGYRLNLYQSFSHFSQSTDTTATRQTEYLALVKWIPFTHTNFDLAYHFVGANVNYGGSNYFYLGHVLYGKATQQLNRFDLSLSGGFYMSELLDSKQIGLHLAVNFAGEIPIKLTSSVYQVFETTQTNGSENRQIFKQVIGVSPYKKLWTEAFINIGNLNYFIDANALYIYNSLDSTVFRTGGSVFYYICKPLTMYVNYTFDKKNIAYSNQLYNQHSITGGFIWQF
ncbi:hypothetical protein MASR2M117_22070 [Paludibacter sp.]